MKLVVNNYFGNANMPGVEFRAMLEVDDHNECEFTLGIEKIGKFQLPRMIELFCKDVTDHVDHDNIAENATNELNRICREIVFVGSKLDEMDAKICMVLPIDRDQEMESILCMGKNYYISSFGKFVSIRVYDAGITMVVKQEVNALYQTTVCEYINGKIAKMTVQ